MNQRIIQAALEVACAGPECKARLVVPTHYRAQAATMAEQAGWKHASRLGWLCPDHRAMRRIHSRIAVPTHEEVQKNRAMEALARYQQAHPEFDMNALADKLRELANKNGSQALQDGPESTEQQEVQ